MARLGSRLAVGAAVFTSALVFSVVVAGAVGTPEVDPSAGTFNAKFTSTSLTCVGEDGGPYKTDTMKFKGGSFDTSSAPGDFSLGGVFTWNFVVTINASTGDGWGSGTMKIVSGGTTITGKATAVVARNSAGGVGGRGFWVGKVLVGGASTVDMTVENFEFTQNTATSIVGTWGGAASVPNLSVKTTLQTC